MIVLKVHYMPMSQVLKSVDATAATQYLKDKYRANILRYEHPHYEVEFERGSDATLFILRWS